MPINKSPLGMNARNYQYIRRYNNRDAIVMADDKLLTKQKLISESIATPNLYAVFEDRKKIRNFDWDTLPPNGFVIKPARGFAGAGILAIKKRVNGVFITQTNEELSKEDLLSHLIDILDGAYSLQYLPDRAFIEERLIPNQFFKKLGAVGLPDLRVIVFNAVPIMSMLRFPTPESKGKANISIGAIALGIDMKTGITTSAFQKKSSILYFPGTKVKVKGIKIPKWDEILLLSSKAQIASGLGYAGIDIVIDKEGNPQILETNARPGLAIQNANNDSLRERLERVDYMSNLTPERGVKISQSLFASEFSEKVKKPNTVLTIIQPVVVHGKNMHKSIECKMDTGAYRTSIDKKLAKELGLEKHTDKVQVESASGISSRPTVKLTFSLSGKKITTIASVADRSKLEYPMIVGYRDMGGFLIKPVHREEE